MFESCGGCCLVVVLIPLLCCVALGGVVYMVNTNAPDAPLSDSFKPTQAEAQAFQNELDRATNQAAAQQSFYIQFYERQIASWMALEGKQFADDNNNLFPFSDMQVGLDDGVITFYGKLDPGVLAIPVEVEVEPQISASGDFEFEISSVDVSGVRAPDFVTTMVSTQFEDLLIEPLQSLPGGLIFYKESLSIEDGVFAVQGRVSP